MVYKLERNALGFTTILDEIADISEDFRSGQHIILVPSVQETTKELAKLVDVFFKDWTNALPLFNKFIEKQLKQANLINVEPEEYFSEINEYIVSVEWLLELEPEDPYNYVYDQIVSLGEILFSKLVYLLMKTRCESVIWLDGRDVIITNDIYRKPEMNNDQSKENLHKKVMPLFKNHKLIISQANTGSTTDNNTTFFSGEDSHLIAELYETITM